MKELFKLCYSQKFPIFFKSFAGNFIFKTHDKNELIILSKFYEPKINVEKSVNQIKVNINNLVLFKKK